ncbi:MAG TPA: class I SAM-dependent methyltransferase [Gaiella sp.]|uniref:class I SAM-dependent methyltransferase n=1 Tax=Gaiella sp. TaxID=2663207 RepID=UPI002D7F4420|nr:class I SAM-dependent methyltransferase [Gaiella sp.]HET9288594.1 class I SAM-dependent methyltransferase [Gaiella sp.]
MRTSPQARTATGAVQTTCNLCGAAVRSAASLLFEKDDHVIVRCPVCGLVFRGTLPTRDELEDIYGPAYFGGSGGLEGREGYLDYVADADVHRANARRRLQRLEDVTVPGRLLDVGCAAGFFVDEATRRGWEACGVDVSRAMIQWGRRHIAAELRVGTLRDVPIDPEVSCVTMWDYIEHALDPRGDLEHAFARLRPGGVLALSTGDAGSALARASLARWHLMTPRHHNFFFSRRTITRLLESVGFEVLAVGHPAAVFPLRYLAHKACLTVDVSLLDALARRLARSRFGALTVPFNLLDVMTVLARRPTMSARAG